MYNYKKLRRTIVDSGERYAPRVHKHRMPFMVLRRVAVRDILGESVHSLGISPLNSAKYTLRGLRDVLTARKVDKATLSAIWEDAFLAMIDILKLYKVDIIQKENAAATLYSTLKGIGYDVVKDSLYYNKNGFSHESLAKAFTVTSRYFNKGLIGAVKHIERFNGRHGTTFDISDFTEDTVRGMTKLYDRMIKGATQAGYYHTLRYFAAFAPRFKLSDDLKVEIKSALANGDYKESILMKIYSEMKKSYKEGLLPAQIGVDLLFDPRYFRHLEFEAKYTSIFK